MDDQNLNPAKVFVGGLGQGTTTFSLRAYFSQYGTVCDAAVVTDKISGRSRGFGFCSFEDPNAADRCLNARHKIDGVSCEVRRAVPRDEARGAAPYDTVDQPGKLFVGGLPEDVTEERLKEHFEQFGTVVQATLMYDKNNHKPRGFGFVIFEDCRDCERATGEHASLGRACEAKKAEPRADARKSRGFGNRFDSRDRFNGPWDDRQGGSGGRDLYGRYPESRGYPPDIRGRAGRYGGYGRYEQPYPFYDPYGCYPGDPSYYGGGFAGYSMYGYEQGAGPMHQQSSSQYQGYDSYGGGGYSPGGGQGYGPDASSQYSGGQGGGGGGGSRGFAPQRAGGRYGQPMVRTTPY